MNNPLTLFDYNADWALKSGYLDPKPVEGFMSREDVLALYGSLGIDGVEIREDRCQPFTASCSRTRRS